MRATRQLRLNVGWRSNFIQNWRIYTFYRGDIETQKVSCMHILAPVMLSSNNLDGKNTWVFFVRNKNRPVLRKFALWSAKQYLGHKSLYRQFSNFRHKFYCVAVFCMIIDHLLQKAVSVCCPLEMEPLTFCRKFMPYIRKFIKVNQR